MAVRYSPSQSRVDLPDPVARWLPYAPLAEEKVLMLMPYELEVH